jgi:hypothetical protein
MVCKRARPGQEAAALHSTWGLGVLVRTSQFPQKATGLDAALSRERLAKRCKAHGWGVCEWVVSTDTPLSDESYPSI